MLSRLSIFDCPFGVLSRLSIFDCPFSVLSRLSIFDCPFGVLSRLSIFDCPFSVLSRLSIFDCPFGVLSRGKRILVLIIITWSHQMKKQEIPQCRNNSRIKYQICRKRHDLSLSWLGTGTSIKKWWRKTSFMGPNCKRGTICHFKKKS